jgi:hypothetical protein
MTGAASQMVGVSMAIIISLLERSYVCESEASLNKLNKC